mgnify:CR=1 FL=1
MKNVNLLLLVLTLFVTSCHNEIKPETDSILLNDIIPKDRVVDGIVKFNSLEDLKTTNHGIRSPDQIQQATGEVT